MSSCGLPRSTGYQPTQGHPSREYHRVRQINHYAGCSTGTLLTYSAQGYCPHPMTGYCPPIHLRMTEATAGCLHSKRIAKPKSCVALTGSYSTKAHYVLVRLNPPKLGAHSSAWACTGWLHDGRTLVVQQYVTLLTFFTDIDLANAEMNTAFNIITYVPFPTPRTNMAYIITSSSQLQDFVAQSRGDVFLAPTPLDGCVRIIFFSHCR